MQNRNAESLAPFSEKQKLAIYGMGEHTEHLLSGYRKQIGPINAEFIFIDSKRRTHSTDYYGHDIYNVKDIGGVELDGIILSSYIYEEEMYQTIKNLYGNRFDVNPDSFINCNDYGNDFEAVIQKVKEIDGDDEYYMSMLRQIPMRKDYDFDALVKLENFLSEIIERG